MGTIKNKKEVVKAPPLKRYFVVGDKLLCFIPRTGSTALLKLIIDKYYPHLNRVKGITPHFKVPSVIDTQNNTRELVAMLRDPVERFESGCAQKKWTLDEGLVELQKERVDIHIRPQSSFLSDIHETKLFKFPDEIDKCAEYLGLPTPVPQINVSKEKEKATNEQKSIVEQVCINDKVKFDKLKIDVLPVDDKIKVR